MPSSSNLPPHDLPTTTPDEVTIGPGAATGVGSWPGTDVLDTMRVTFGELGDPPALPYLPELPARGPGADMVGRAAGLLVDMPVDLQPSGWRLVDHPGRDHHRTRSWLRQDLDVLAEVADGYQGLLKVQVTGPWTLASSLWLPRLERAVVDPGACRDLVASLAEGVSQHLAEVSRLVPGARLVLQLDEPGIQAVLDGSLPTASGFGRLRAIEEPLLVEGLRAVLDAATGAGAVRTVIHCCASKPPVELLVRTGASALSLDVSQLGQQRWEQMAEATENGTALWAGAVPTASGVKPQVVADSIANPWRRLGLAVPGLADVVVTPACGLAGSSPQQARSALGVAREASRILSERAQE
ncbi:methionine synthase [Kineosporia succinea]|uniref:Methionine synthase II (Cobalamin-independent) n=1 Tax=Kineosporia succinea TaxID=84632 RepID=A0ABT9NWK8_9ACTN|nr:methionine synthase [Kineosporia succinea]MDP9824813.1 methionine synthase II (cobalamin-independent) [Kineosporia succinea]